MLIRGRLRPGTHSSVLALSLVPPTGPLNSFLLGPDTLSGVTSARPGEEDAQVCQPVSSIVTPQSLAGTILRQSLEPGGRAQVVVPVLACAGP